MMTYYRVLLDTSYLLPMFGLEVDIAPSEEINDLIASLTEGDGEIHVQDLSALEAYGKTVRIAEKTKIEEGKLLAAQGYIDFLSDQTMIHYSFSNFVVFQEAQKIREKHRDLFDCFIFGTACAYNLLLVTEDKFAHNNITTTTVWDWKTLKKKIG